jgi:hypothetical protein
MAGDTIRATIVFPQQKITLMMALTAGCATPGQGGVENLDLLQEVCAGPVPARPRVDVLELSPAAGKPVDKTTVVRARLSYSIPPTFAGDCILATQWVSSKGGSFLVDSKNHIARPELARGVETLSVPMALPLANPELARPVSVRFVVLNLKGGAVIAASELFTYGPGQASSAPTLTVRSLDPAPDETLTPGTVVKALVAYHIPDFAPDDVRYEIRTRLAGTKPGTTHMPGSLKTRAHPTGPTGLAVLTLPLAELLLVTETRRPLELTFALTRKEGGGLWVVTQSAPALYDICKVIGTPPPEEH